MWLTRRAQRCLSPVNVLFVGIEPFYFPVGAAYAGARFLLNEQITSVEKIEKKDSNGGESCCFPWVRCFVQLQLSLLLTLLGVGSDAVLNAVGMRASEYTATVRSFFKFVSQLDSFYRTPRTPIRQPHVPNALRSNRA